MEPDRHVWHPHVRLNFPFSTCNTCMSICMSITQLPRSPDGAFVVLRFHTLMGAGEEARLKCVPTYLVHPDGGLLMVHVRMLFLCGPSFTNCWMEIGGRCICKKPEQARLECGEKRRIGNHTGDKSQLERALHVEQKLGI
ncbi:hypothetical protein BSKO_01848 [Bryopsis sp. KO-2023]|nr:hypothetical protein BSKO_01848 [Bryopsis sp. KO-2023]